LKKPLRKFFVFVVNSPIFLSRRVKLDSYSCEQQPTPTTAQEGLNESQGLIGHSLSAHLSNRFLEIFDVDRNGFRSRSSYPFFFFSFHWIFIC
jgi:hypothetical protein